MHILMENKVQYSIILFVCNLHIFPLISLKDIVSMNGPTLILKIISQYDIKHIMTHVSLVRYHLNLTSGGDRF